MTGNEGERKSRNRVNDTQQRSRAGCQAVMLLLIVGIEFTRCYLLHIDVMMTLKRCHTSQNVSPVQEHLFGKKKQRNDRTTAPVSCKHIKAEMGILQTCRPVETCLHTGHLSSLYTEAQCEVIRSCTLQYQTLSPFTST